MKRVAIVQSNYIPWKGYFDLIASVDEFVLYDDRQFTRRDWRNRNRIKTSHGTQWLTIPVQTKGKYTQRIDETLIEDSGWAEHHWGRLAQAYRDAPYFVDLCDVVEAAYARCGEEELLSVVNRILIEAVCAILEIPTAIRWSTEYEANGGMTERLLDICLQAGGREYVSGPAAQAYLDEDIFADAGVAVSWMDYSEYPQYTQAHGPFEHTVTVLDLLFHTGHDARRYMKAVPRAAS